MITNPLTNSIDLTNCDREPIHIPGSIQPHGILLTLSEQDLTILQASANACEKLLGQTGRIVGSGLADVFGDGEAALLQDELAKLTTGNSPVYIRTVTSTKGDNREFHAIAHRNDGVLILELEPAPRSGQIVFKELYPMLSLFFSRLHSVQGRAELMQLVAELVRELTGFDRTLIYQFDEDWNGTVIAESRNDVLPSYMDLRFPASDIPRQARELYRLNRMRLISDVNYSPSKLEPPENPVTGRPLDLSFAGLRSVSPIHLEYMRNMGTGASMSMSILNRGELWGLISCHNKQPKQVSFDVRTACDFIAQIVAVQLDSHERNAEAAERIRLKTFESVLLARMAQQDNFIDGIRKSQDDLLRFAGANGAAVLFEGQCTLLGRTMPEEVVRELADWLDSYSKDEVLATDCLNTLWEPAQQYADIASGLLSIRISKLHRSFVLWFRPEVVQTVKWGGDPNKPVDPEIGGMRLHPRSSFETWKETVRYRSRPWSPAEVDSARDLRNAIVGVVLRKAEELADLSAELERSNRELEAFSYSVSHDLRAPFRHIVGYAELLKKREKETISGDSRRYLDTIVESAHYAGTLVDNLLELSRITRTAMYTVSLDLNQMFAEVRKELTQEDTTRNIEWNISNLPVVSGDPVMLRLVIRNLLSNAVKYTRNRKVAQISVSCEIHDGEYIFRVQDNGVGFDMRYVGKLFGVFQRLHRQEDYEGTGIGLANVRRIISRHRGRTWAEGELDRGATFYFTLPVNFEGETVAIQND